MQRTTHAVAENRQVVIKPLDVIKPWKLNFNHDSDYCSHSLQEGTKQQNPSPGIPEVLAYISDILDTDLIKTSSELVAVAALDGVEPGWWRCLRSW
jgi:hypothetical protein